MADRILLLREQTEQMKLQVKMKELDLAESYNVTARKNIDLAEIVSASDKVMVNNVLHASMRSPQGRARAEHPIGSIDNPPQQLFRSPTVLPLGNGSPVPPDLISAAHSPSGAISQQAFAGAPADLTSGTPMAVSTPPAYPDFSSDSKAPPAAAPTFSFGQHRPSAGLIFSSPPAAQGAPLKSPETMNAFANVNLVPSGPAVFGNRPSTAPPVFGNGLSSFSSPPAAQGALQKSPETPSNWIPKKVCLKSTPPEYK